MVNLVAKPHFYIFFTQQLVSAVQVACFITTELHGYESFTWTLKSNCIRQPKGQLPSSVYNRNTLKILICTQSLYMKLPYSATLKCICNDSFTDVLRVVMQCIVVVRC